MIEILTVQQMYTCDRAAATGDVTSRVLMERAAGAARDIFLSHPDLLPGRNVLILCGGGNNGGDGMALARFLKEDGLQVQIAYAGRLDGSRPDTSGMSAEAARQYQLAVDSGVPVVTELPDFSAYTSVVDALFGIGLSRPVEGKAAEWIAGITQAGLPVMALDIPSGIQAGTGEILSTPPHSVITCTFGQAKPGCFLYPGAGFCGEVYLCNIGIPCTEEAGPVRITALEESDIPALLPARPVRSNKGTFGRVLSVCGSSGMAGAAILSGRSAYRCGAGLVEVATHENNRLILQTSLPEAVLSTYTDESPVLPGSSMAACTAVLAGCGLGQSATSLSILQHVLSGIRKPLVLDADALNLIAAHPELWDSVPAGTIVTPHMAEMARLSGVSTGDVVSRPAYYAGQLSEKHSVVCVMKDAHTVITSPDGRMAINLSGNSGLATGGSGDVLAGCIVSLLAQGCHPFDAARLGVYLHGLAGEKASGKYGEHGAMSGDLPEILAQIIRRFESR